MSQFSNRTVLWLNKPASDVPLIGGLYLSAQVVNGQIAGESVRFIAVVPDANSHYPRATDGEVGLLKGWTLAKVVNKTITASADQPVKWLIVVVIDVPSQAYGCREGAFGIRQVLAGAAGTYAKARLTSHLVTGPTVEKAMLGVFLAYGYQVNRLIAFNDSDVLVHAMSKESVARIMLHTMEALEKLAVTIPPTTYDVSNYVMSGLLSALLDINNLDAPDENDLSLVSRTLCDAIADVRKDISLKCRLGAENRYSPQLVRGHMRASW